MKNEIRNILLVWHFYDQFVYATLLKWLVQMLSNFLKFYLINSSFEFIKMKNFFRISNGTHLFVGVLNEIDLYGTLYLMHVKTITLV